MWSSMSFKMGKKIDLRELDWADRHRLAELMNNKKIWNNIRDYIPYPYSVSDAEYFINLVEKDIANKVFAIEFENEFCGVVSLTLKKDIYRKSAEIGYWMGEPFWGKGIMSEAVRLMIKHGFEEFDLIRIFARVFENNTASMRVLEKNGFKKEGVFKKALVKNGKILDEHRFYILKEDFKFD